MKRINQHHVFFVCDNPYKYFLHFILPLTDVTLIRIKATIFLQKAFLSSNIQVVGIIMVSYGGSFLASKIAEFQSVAAAACSRGKPAGGI